MVERDDRPPVGTFFADEPLVADGLVSLGEAAAHHARVKRLATGHPVRVTNGRGTIGSGHITDIRRAAIDVRMITVADGPRPTDIRLYVPVADRERMLWLAEKATELGVASWRAVRFRRSASVSPRGEGSAFAQKVLARMTNALEQSGGAWLPEIEPDAAVDAVQPVPGSLPVMLQADAPPLLSVLSVLASGAAASVSLLFGPEGGMEADEREALATAGWVSASLAATTLRFETAGVAGIAVVRAAQLHREP